MSANAVNHGTTARVAGYTEAHPVGQNYECRACQVSMSGDHCTDEAVVMFNERHKECEQ